MYDAYIMYYNLTNLYVSYVVECSQKVSNMFKVE